VGSDIDCAVLVGIIAGALLLGDQVGIGEVAGAALILGGAIVARRTPAAAAPARPAARRRMRRPSTRRRSFARPPSLSSEQIGQAPLARVATFARCRAS
jgi:hypothetical protein